MIRVRYAPSPTGFLHIGNARTALFNYLYAKKYGGSLIVRIEDTDTERNVDTGIDNQLSMLKWLGIDWDESIDKPGEYGPYRQLERLDVYKKYADLLLEKGLAYKCYCTKEELEAEKNEQIARGDSHLHYSRKCLNHPAQDKPYAIRFKVPDQKTYIFNDLVKGEVTFKSEDIGDWVMMKQNGIPTYNFACVIDDHLMKISHVLRGEDHITNTPRQMMVYDAFDWEIPTFGHMTLIVNHRGKKLSKRDADIIQFIEQYKDLGYLPEALFNYVSLLGFSPGEEEILSQASLIDAFEATKLSNHPATFDPDKLKFINSQYIKKSSLDQLKVLVHPFVEKAHILDGKDHDFEDSLIDVFKDRLDYGAELVDLYHEFLDKPFEWDVEMRSFMKVEGVQTLLEVLLNKLRQCDPWLPETIKDIIKESGKESGAKGKMLFMPSRIAVSASMHGPELPKLMHLMGKNTILTRIQQSLTWLDFENE